MEKDKIIKLDIFCVVLFNKIMLRAQANESSEKVMEI